MTHHNSSMRANVFCEFKLWFMICLFHCCLLCIIIRKAGFLCGPYFLKKIMNFDHWSLGPGNILNISCLKKSFICDKQVDRLISEVIHLISFASSPYQNSCFANFPLNTLRPRQNGCRFPDNIFKYIFFNENVWISLKISLKFVPKVRIKNIPALV